MSKRWASRPSQWLCSPSRSLPATQWHPLRGPHVGAAPQSRARSASTASGPAPRPRRFGKVIYAFNKTYPGVQVNYKPVGNNLPTVLATAIAGGHPPDMADIAQPGLIKQFADQGISSRSPTPRASWRRTSHRPGCSSAPSTASSTGCLQGGNKSTLWYNMHAFKTAGVKAPRRGSSCLRREHAAGVRYARLLDRRGRRLDAHRPVREHLPAAGGPAKYDSLVGAQDQVDRSVGHRGAEDDGAGDRDLLEPRGWDIGRTAVQTSRLGEQCLLRPRRRRRSCSRATSSQACHLVDKGEARDGLQRRSPFPSITRARTRPRSRSAATRSSRSATRRRSRRS